MKYLSGKTPFRRALRITTFAALSILVAIGVLATLFYYEFRRTPAKPDLAPAQNQAEANRQDLQYLKRIMAFDRSFTPENRQAFERLVDDLIARAADLDPAQFEMNVARAVAQADNAHTNAKEVAGRLNSLPLRFNWFAEGLYVVKADPAYADLLGARVVEEGGRTPEALAGDLAVYVGGPDNFRRALAPNFLQSPQALHAAGLLPSAGEAAFTFQLRDGTLIQRTVAADPHPIVRSRWPDRALSAVPVPGDTHKWVHILDGMTALPLDLQRPEAAYWHEYLPDIDALYMQINTVRDAGEIPLKAYLSGVLDELTQRRPRNVIVDLRFNSGGNYLLTTDFTKRLPQHIAPDGKVFIVTSANTFSAAIVTTARLKYFAAERGYIVGEQVGDRGQHWGEGRTLELPNSKIRVGYQRGYHDWERDECPVTRCNWFNLFYGVPAGSLAPRISAPRRFADYIAGRDSALEAIAAVIRK